MAHGAVTTMVINHLLNLVAQKLHREVIADSDSSGGIVIPNRWEQCWHVCNPVESIQISCQNLQNQSAGMDGNKNDNWISRCESNTKMIPIYPTIIQYHYRIFFLQCGTQMYPNLKSWTEEEIVK